MALCLAESLVVKSDCDPRDQMTRYANWYQWGYWSSTGQCFDIGMATREAIQQYLRAGNALAGSEDARSAGNGSLMRLAPVAMAYAYDEQRVQEMAALSSRTTHAAAECLDACRLFAVALSRALLVPTRRRCWIWPRCRLAARASPRLRRAAGAAKVASRSRVRAMWCTVLRPLYGVSTGTSFEAAVLEAANLGDDADTTAAIAGQIAGAFWGRSGIPAHWLERLHQQTEIRALAQSVHALNQVLAG